MTLPTDPHYPSTPEGVCGSFSPKESSNSGGRAWSKQPTGLPLDGLLPVTTTESEASLAGRVVLLPEAIEGPGVIFKEVIPEPVIQRTVTLEDRLEAALSKNLISSPVDRKLLLNFLKKHRFSLDDIEKVLIELDKLTPVSLELFLKKFVWFDSPLWCFVDFWIENLQQGTEAQIDINREEYFKQPVAKDNFDEICKVAKVLYGIESSSAQAEPTASSVALELIHTSPGLQAAKGDQVLYQRQFIATVEEVSKKIKNKEPFNAILEYIANQRHEMAKSYFGETNLFGIRRSNKDDSLYTSMIGAYEKYRDLFLKSDKEKWKFNALTQDYRMSVMPEGAQNPIELTSIFLDTVKVRGPLDDSDGYPVFLSKLCTVWQHIPQENIEAVLKEAERIFKELPAPAADRTDESLEMIMRSVANLHWWLAQACPYQRGSAAIAKMMTYAVLKHYGIEAGGFGSVEPDCMALIQHPDQFIENYSKLMVFPPPRWITTT